MIRRLCVVLLSAGLGAGVAIGCDREDPEPSPTVTIGSQPTVDDPSDDQATEPPPEPGSEARPDQHHRADLRQGTEQQQSRLIEGKTAFFQDDYEQATAIFEELAFDEPVTGDTVSAAIALAQIYIETGRPDEAIALFERFEDHVSHLPEVLLVLARTYASLDEFDQAIDTYERAYEENSDYIFILTEAADLLLKVGRNDEASDLLERYETHVHTMAAYLESPGEASEEERLYVVDILALLHDERAHQALQKALQDPSEQIRIEAAAALGDGAVFDAEPALRQAATDDESEHVRRTARQSLEKLRSFEDNTP